MGTFESIRADVGQLSAGLVSTRDQLDGHAAAIDTDEESVLPGLYRGTLEAVCRDLLDDAIATLTGLEALSEDSAAERLIEAADLVQRLRAGRR